MTNPFASLSLRREVSVSVPWATHRYLSRVGFDDLGFRSRLWVDGYRSQLAISDVERRCAHLDDGTAHEWRGQHVSKDVGQGEVRVLGPRTRIQGACSAHKRPLARKRSEEVRRADVRRLVPFRGLSRAIRCRNVMLGTRRSAGAWSWIPCTTV